LVATKVYSGTGADIVMESITLTTDGERPHLARCACASTRAAYTQWAKGRQDQLDSLVSATWSKKS
jgi:hypothetical protein